MDKKYNSAILRVNRERLFEILQSIYTLTRVKITLYDAQHREVMTYPEEQSCFCKLVRAHELTRCRASDEHGFSLCEHSDHFAAYHCHAGLIEVVAPLKQSGENLGYIMFGQMLPDEDLPACIHRLSTHFDYLTDDKRFLQEAISSLPMRNDAEIHAAIQLIEVCISYLLFHRIVFTEAERLAERLDNYIAAHLAEEITAEALYCYFGVGRTTFYTTTQKALGCSVMTYVRRYRIEAAQRLLEKENLPIAEIACRVGFTDYNYFLRVFKKQTGISCNAYRRKIARENDSQ